MKTVLLLRTERDGTEQERNDKKEERERNDLAEGHRSITERNNFKKVETCPVPRPSPLEKVLSE